MKIGQHATVREFLDRAGPFLMQAEAKNGLLLGICSDLLAGTQRCQQGPLLLAVQQGDRVIGAGLMTPPYDLILSRLPSDAAQPLAEYLSGCGIPVPGVVGPSPETEVFARCWAVKTGKTLRPTVNQRLYECRHVTLPEASPGRLRPAVDAELPLLTGWCREFRREVGFGEEEDHGAVVWERIARGQLYVWEDDRPVSMACAGGETDHGIRLFLVYTPPDLRRKGYATSCVARLTGRLLESGRMYCFLFADLANPTSNNIYQSIGYRSVCDWQTWRVE